MSHSPTLPGWAYTDPGIFEREREAIFHRAWHYAGALADLKEPGDFLTVPKGVRHCTRPGGERSVNLTFEKTDTETIFG